MSSNADYQTESHIDNVICSLLGDKQPCYCHTYQCAGALRSKRTIQDHTSHDRTTSYIQQSEKASSCYTYTDDIKHWPDSTEEIPIHEGSSVTLVEAVAKKLALFVDNSGLSKAALSDILKEKKQEFPHPNAYPENYNQAKRIVEKYLTKTIKYDICINDCVVFRKHSEQRDYSNLTHCPICEEARYKSSNSNDCKARKHIIYIKVEDQLRKRFGESNIAKLVYAGDVDLEEGILSDIQHGEQWKKWFNPGGVFASNADGAIPLAFTTDGMNPNNNLTNKLSMWPLLLSILKMPGPYRNLLGVGLLLVTILPGYNGKEP